MNGILGRRAQLILALVGVVGTTGMSADDQTPAADRPLVLLELFTSEGCSSCPPADRLLEELAGGELVAGVDVAPLSFHVDYWNHLGWRDPYSRADFSRRQESYAATLGADVFTPQLVIDGETQFVGSDRREALATIARAGARPRAALELEGIADPQAPPLKSAWRIAIDAGSLRQRPATPHLFVAVTEDDLASSVSRGENAGRTLRHVGVVRSLRPLGRVWFDQSGRVTKEVTIDLDRAWRTDQLHVVAWIADGPTGRVLGSARAALQRPGKL